ncbi:MAG: hypothetical protein QW561_03690 [Candidatus Aenigmatarchaeota archaeon]
MKSDRDKLDFTRFEYIDYEENINKDKFLYKVLKSLGLVTDEENWEIHIGGNQGGIRYITKTSKIR